MTKLCQALLQTLLLTLVCEPDPQILTPCLPARQVYGYQSLKAGSQAEQLLGGFVQRGASLPIDGPAPIIASKFFTIPVRILPGLRFSFLILQRFLYHETASNLASCH